ncbi:Response regulator receiver domain-containing protein [Halogranum amylolyticum]|uniref:Response regulator receiver domain-containing protein n=1 Tax=Halogranum amylolyticum TaxID=660520 RepID=A0A1H8W346_9EURY|nr:response regulator [Halogranum amylolyticum]SEP22061.1 Response regulator receiver domain-containing protein [Halogranum amylolyticum]
MSSVERRILLVEDDPAALRLFEEAMAESRIATLEVATTGREALSVLTATDDDPEHTYPDLIVLDVHLPDLTGLDVLEELKSSSAPLRQIPVLMLSTSTEQATVDRAYDLGANAYLAKPESYDDLLTLLEELRSFWLQRVEFPSQ